MDEPATLPASGTVPGVLSDLRGAARRHAFTLLAVGAVFLFSAGGADVLARYRCSHHDGATMERSGVQRAETADHDAGSRHEDDHGPCTCAGRCTLGGSQGAAVAMTIPSIPAPSDVVRGVTPTATSVLRGPVSYLHPLPNAPPLPS